MPLRIAVLSTGRQDWGILRSTCALLRDDLDFELILILGGMHCSKLFGQTRDRVREDGFERFIELPWIPDDDAPPVAHNSPARR